MEVYSYGYSRMEEGARSQSNAIMLAPTRHRMSLSHSVMAAETIAFGQAIVFAPEGIERVIETQSHLGGSGAKSEDMARMVSAGGRITNNAILVGEASGTNGFLGCDGLKLGAVGEIKAVLSLIARAENTQLSHEVSVGKIDGEKLACLMASGLDGDMARDLVVQGCLSLPEDRLPESARTRMAEMTKLAKSGGM
jgi:hypothetical protein